MHIVLDRSFANAKRYGDPLSAVMLAVDHFKRYNDTHGHIAGDTLLVDIAKILLRKVRDVDLVIRYGGEEFLILFAETEIERASEVAERIRISELFLAFIIVAFQNGGRPLPVALRFIVSHFFLYLSVSGSPVCIRKREFVIVNNFKRELWVGWVTSLF